MTTFAKTWGNFIQCDPSAKPRREVRPTEKGKYVVVKDPTGTYLKGDMFPAYTFDMTLVHKWWPVGMVVKHFKGEVGTVTNIVLNHPHSGKPYVSQRLIDAEGKVLPMSTGIRNRKRKP